MMSAAAEVNRAYPDGEPGPQSPNLPAPRVPGIVSVRPDQPDQRLSRISTLWSLVHRAHQGPAEAVHSARRQLLERYGGAIRRYLHKLLPDPDAADEVYQEF